VALRKPVALDQLQALDDVDHAEALADGRYRVVFVADATPEALVASAVHNEWGLYELIPEQQSLEDLFIELTQHEEAAAS
jgi:ABC-2 type transport system ATP-binding protein